ncbi:hypothetical protein LCGC14_0596930 [marine sediment metagenome]|uniref:Uncharacterized protein n=1 Tax=marine sediment metagenome TaxID=412755 RepID=A0A0F9RBN5_9ZZZZ
MGKINIEQGIYVFDWKKAYDRYDFYFKMEINLITIANRFKDLISEKADKFYEKYGIRDIPITIGRDLENNIEAIAICYPYFDKFKPKVGVDIVTGRIKRMRGDLKYETTKPKRDKHGEIILNKDGKPTIQHRIRYYRPYKLDAKVLDKHGNETDKLKYPFVVKLNRKIGI